MILNDFQEYVCELTPLDNFLLYYLNSLVLRNKPDYFQAIQIDIKSTIQDIRLHLVEKTLANWIHRVSSYRRYFI